MKRCPDVHDPEPLHVVDGGQAGQDLDVAPVAAVAVDGAGIARDLAGVGEDLWPQVIELAGRLAFDDACAQGLVVFIGEEIEILTEMGPFRSVEEG